MKPALPWYRRVLLTVALIDMCAFTSIGPLRDMMPPAIFWFLMANLVFASILTAIDVWRLPR